jgi:N-formylglutamate deformylase
MHPAPFQLIATSGDESPVVVEIPHAGTDVPSQFLSTLVAPARALGRDADLHVDALYADAVDAGASVLVARVSRYVIDLNRGEADVDADIVENGPQAPRYNHGLVWRATSDGERALLRPLTRIELEDRLDSVYRPYHRALATELARKRRKFGVAVLLAAHSMPSVGRSTGGAPGLARADVVPGTRGRTTAALALIDAVDASARARNWSVRHDDPYAGGYSTQYYGRPDAGVHAVQVELSRRLYLDEATLAPRAPEFDDVRAWCKDLVATLGRAALTLARA